MTFLRLLVVAALVAVTPLTAAFADATIPTKDIPGSRDNELAKRYEGSFIISYMRQAFTDFSIPLSKLERVEGQRDQRNNTLYKPKQAVDVEGALTRMTYLLPAERSPLEVLRNYQDVIKAAGGDVLFECKTDQCGGDPLRAVGGGGGNQSLMMYFFAASDLKEGNFSNAECALNWASISDQRFFAAKIAQNGGDAYVTVQTFVLKTDTYCKAINNRTVALVQVLEPKPRDQKMVLVKSDAMAQGLNQAGRIALYGILFDFDKADIKPESDPQLAEMANLLKSNAGLKVFIVGHTDNKGTLAYNLDLSQRRADAVTRALSGRYGIGADRMLAKGVGQLSPLASNDSEEGRAKNRRVELVRQ